MYLAYLTLISGLLLSLISEYYSIVGLMAIFSAMPITIATMGVALGIAKIVSTVWLKQNWTIAPTSIKIYLSSAIVILMIITSLGCFGLLSKAHSDQSLVSGDVLAKISVYDEKIKTSKENIDANRKVLKQMDEAVDQVMGRSTSETGADKAVAIRKGQQKERARLQSEIQTEQKTIGQLSEERAPIAAEVRKVEAEVGPIKYIAAFVYGNTDPSILERAVTWVIILIIVVFDPLAVILLLSSQISFQNFREREQEIAEGDSPEKESDVVSTATVTELVEGDSPGGTTVVVDTEPPTVTESILEDPVKEEYVKWPGGQEPLFCNKCATELFDAPGIGLYCPNKDCGILDDYDLEVPAYEEDDGALTEDQIEQVRRVANTYIEPIEVADSIVVEPSGYVQNEEQKESGIWSKTITQAEYAEIGEQRRRDTIINQWTDRVKNKDVSLHHVPVDILNEVKAKL